MERLLTEEQFEQIVAEVTKRIREAQIEENNRRPKPSELSVKDYTPEELVHARATELYENLKYIADGGLRQEDLPLFLDSVELCRELAVYGFAIAKQQMSDAKKAQKKRALDNGKVYNKKAKKVYF
ncbi:hypothetical protein HPULCUR_003572 [Helicostylum pulchrum]|uniref:Uncharacterized protein n=1 Tax=Helicostylum pulchrum TaxID=562976 RepID=A0ABP9XVU9_9FUNG